MSITGRERKEEEGRGIHPKLYSWDQSATERWSGEKLIWLRDEHPSNLAEALWELDGAAQYFALYELVTHGNFRKAALVARELVKQHPVCKKSIRKAWDRDWAKILLDVDPLCLPSRPDEIKR